MEYKDIDDLKEKVLIEEELLELIALIIDIEFKKAETYEEFMKLKGKRDILQFLETIKENREN